MQPQGPMPPQYPQYTPVPPPQQPSNIPPGYEFIHNTPPAPRRSMTPQSPITRALVVLGGILLIIIIFSIIKSVASGGGNKAEFVSVVQDQQELIHLATNAQQQDNLTVTNNYFINTAAVTLTSDQSSTLTYMTKNKIKVGKKQLIQKVSLATDKQLTDAAAASTYDTVLKSVMQTKLTQYQRDLQAAYLKTKGPNGHKLLNDNFDHTKLLLVQLNGSSTNQ